MTDGETMLTVTCPYCRRKNKTRRKFIGMSGRCKCGRTFLVAEEHTRICQTCGQLVDAHASTCSACGRDPSAPAWPKHRVPARARALVQPDNTPVRRLPPRPPKISSRLYPASASGIFGHAEILAVAACLLGLALLAISPLMPWLNVFTGGILGIAGDGKIVAALSALALGVVLHGLRRPPVLPLAMLLASAWGVFAACWMLSLIYTVAGAPGKVLHDENVVAFAFATQSTPGSGLYVGVLGAVIVVVSASVYERVVAPRGAPLVTGSKRRLLAFLVLVVLGTVFWAYSGSLRQAVMLPCQVDLEEQLDSTDKIDWRLHYDRMHGTTSSRERPEWTEYQGGGLRWRMD